MSPPHSQRYPDIDVDTLTDAEQSTMQYVNELCSAHAASKGVHTCSVLAKAKRSRFDRWLLIMKRKIFHELFAKHLPVKRRPPRPQKLPAHTDEDANSESDEESAKTESTHSEDNDTRYGT